MLRSVWKKKKKRKEGGGGNVGHDVPVLLRSQFSLRCQALQLKKNFRLRAHAFHF